MKCPHCQAEIEPTSKGWLTMCPSCGHSLAEGSGLVTVPGEESATVTETALSFFGFLCVIAGLIAAGFAFVDYRHALQCVGVAAALVINGLILWAMRHGLRYLRLILNSLARFRARPLGTQSEE